MVGLLNPTTGLLSALGLEMAEVMRGPRDFLIVVDHAGIVQNLKPYELFCRSHVLVTFVSNSATNGK